MLLWVNPLKKITDSLTYRPFRAYRPVHQPAVFHHLHPVISLHSNRRHSRRTRVRFLEKGSSPEDKANRLNRLRRRRVSFRSNRREESAHWRLHQAACACVCTVGRMYDYRTASNTGSGHSLSNRGPYHSTDIFLSLATPLADLIQGASILLSAAPTNPLDGFVTGSVFCFSTACHACLRPRIHMG